jgi:type II secretion system protein I
MRTRIPPLIRLREPALSTDPGADLSLLRALRPGGTSAFTLIEVMIAMGIFFMAVFAILGLVTTNLRNARRLQDKPVDASMIIAQVWLTNAPTEGSGSGDFGKIYPGYKWSSNCVERQDFCTNGLFQIDFTVSGPSTRGQRGVETRMSVLQWNPNPPVLGAGAPGGGVRR